MTMPTVGQRIEVIESYWFDNGTIHVGKFGTIIKSDDRIFVKMDEKIAGLEANIMSFYPECGPQKHPIGGDMTIVEWFYHHCKIVSAKELIDDLRNRITVWSSAERIALLTEYDRLNKLIDNIPDKVVELGGGFTLANKVSRAINTARD